VRTFVPTKTINKMKTKFEVTNWLSANRAIVIAKYEELTKENFFQGQSLKDFMIAILNLFVINNVKSEKRAAKMMPFLIGKVYFDFSSPVAHLKN